MASPRVLLVDDEKNILLTIRQSLELEDYQVVLASSGAEAIEAVENDTIDAVLLDVRMPDMDGLTALAELLKHDDRLPVIMMSGHANIETAVRATQLGARDFLEKPVARERLLLALRRALEHRAVVDELHTLRAQAGSDDMVGNSPQLHHIFTLIARAAPTDGRVLILGENGTGKELIAKAIHQHSKRAKLPFIKLNCAAVPHELIESELFGHEKGSFTGAVAARRGKFEQAHGGTLFLDEVGDMSLPMQAKLLRVLQEGEFERVGGHGTQRVDVRVVAATNKDLTAEIAAGRFREDLYFRLAVVVIRNPPLRERLTDLPLLAQSFIDEACRRNGRKSFRLSQEAVDTLATYRFPGNIRELRNLMERLAILSDSVLVGRRELEQLLPTWAGSPVPQQPMTVPVFSAAEGSAGRLPGVSTIDPTRQPRSGAAGGVVNSGATSAFRPHVAFRQLVDEAEREIILGALAHTRDNAAEAARMLDLERGHFYKKMKSLGLKRAGGETSAE